MKRLSEKYPFLLLFLAYYSHHGKRIAFIEYRFYSKRPLFAFGFCGETKESCRFLVFSLHVQGAREIEAGCSPRFLIRKGGKLPENGLCSAVCALLIERISFELQTILHEHLLH